MKPTFNELVAILDEARARLEELGDRHEVLHAKLKAVIAAAKGEGPVECHVFTFCGDHVHPLTGASLKTRFVEIEAAGPEEARGEMVRRFGRKWGFQYPSRKTAEVERWELRPLTGLEALGTLGTRRQEACANGCAITDEDTKTDGGRDVCGTCGTIA